MSCIDQLEDQAKLNLLSSVFSKSYFLWIGSGFSYNFGYGSWEDVLKRLAFSLNARLSLMLRIH